MVPPEGCIHIDSGFSHLQNQCLIMIFVDFSHFQGSDGDEGQVGPQGPEGEGVRDNHE